MFDSDLIYEISCWFHLVDPGGHFFDWDTNFQADDFAFFIATAPIVGTPQLNLTNINQPEPKHYDHSYYTEIPQADINNLIQNSNKAA